MTNNVFNLILAILLSIGIILGWQYFYEKPRLQKINEERASYAQSKIKEVSVAKTTILPRNEAITLPEKRVKIKTSSLSGSILLKGLRLDDLILSKYKQDLSPNSENVELFSPSESKESYFVEIGWFGSSSTELPSSNTNWASDKNELTPSSPITLKWINKDRVEFIVEISIDDDYLFTITQKTINKSDRAISTKYYGLINKIYDSNEKLVNILHQGPIGTINNELQEYSYDNIKDKKSQKFPLSQVNWLGITDKYWLAAFIPDGSYNYSSNFSYGSSNGSDKFQIDFMSPAQIIEAGQENIFTHKLFAGAKKVDLLDKYEKLYNIKLFDRAIDFGWFYILTKPVFNALNFFYDYVGNFGISILIVTIIIKLLMFTFANKSYRSMKKIKKLQPEVERIKTRYKEDKNRLNQEIMTLYQKEKVNPLSGCLPLILQIPVFFSIYKVLYVTIEMRQAPFFGWVKDLSAPDPTTIFNLFGLLPFTPPSFLMIGAWPILMALTMFLQQRMSPEPTDPVQAQVMRFMPLMFLVMFSNFPVGLLIYWSWNNILSIIQQYSINKLDRNDN